MNSFQRNVLVFSRVLVALMFLLNGLGLVNQTMAEHELIEHGAPASLATFLMLGARTIEVVAGFSLVFGVYPQLAALALLVFLVPTTFLTHAFWQAAGTASYTPQLLNFLKNTSMAGGLLFIGATPSQPTLLPRSSRSMYREQIRDQSGSRNTLSAS